MAGTREKTVGDERYILSVRREGEGFSWRVRRAGETIGGGTAATEAQAWALSESWADEFASGG